MIVLSVCRMLFSITQPQPCDVKEPFLPQVRIWLITVGHTAAFGTMFAEIWRIHALFKSISVQKRVRTE